RLQVGACGRIGPGAHLHVRESRRFGTRSRNAHGGPIDRSNDRRRESEPSSARLRGAVLLPRGSEGSLATQLRHVLSRGALLALHDVEFNTLAFAERLESAALDRRVMDEAILLSILRRDKAKALRVVEPLNGASRTHCSTPSELICRVGSARNAVLTDTVLRDLVLTMDVPRRCGTGATQKRRS